MLYARVVCIVDIINADNGMSLLEEHGRSPRADETSRACYQIM
jgi:hypothetical protein